MTIIGALPNTISNGQAIDANPLMADFNFIVNQVNANALPVGSISPGALVNIQAFSASGTYTPTTGANKAIVFGVGGGGGGGGAPATGGAQASAGTGGNAGAFGAIFIPSGLVSQTVTIGAAGVGVSGGGGTNGGTTLFGALLSCPGGLGGIGNGPSTAFILPSSGPSAVATGTGIIINGAGPLGAPSIVMSTALNSILGGNGASTPWGAGGSGAAGANGFSASGVGSGGGGAGAGPSSGPFAGGSGTGGRIVVYEFA